MVRRHKLYGYLTRQSLLFVKFGQNTFGSFSYLVENLKMQRNASFLQWPASQGLQLVTGHFTPKSFHPGYLSHLIK